MATDELVWAADSFGEVIRRARTRRQLTQKQLAALCGDVSPMYISQIENADRIPKLGICRLLAKALGLDERRLLLLAYRHNAPAEIRELLLRQEAMPLSDRCKNLLRALSALSEDQQHKILDFLEGALNLVRGHPGSGELSTSAEHAEADES